MGWLKKLFAGGDSTGSSIRKGQADPVELLLSVKRKIEALGGPSIGPGEINPGISMNIDQVVEALRTGRDPSGSSITRAQVGNGLKRLVGYVNRTEWYLVASGTIENGSVEMLKTYIFDLQMITDMI